MAEPEGIDNVSAGGFVECVRGPFTIGSRAPLPDDRLDKIVQVVIRPEGPSVLSAGPDVREPPRALGGRTIPRVFEVPGWGRVFFKRYSHGGILRKITGGKFLALGALRSRDEFAVLEEVRAIGVRAPQPLAYVKRGSLMYATWLLMEELPQTTNLVDVAATNPERLAACMPLVAEQIVRLIQARILHIDLHPGNVLLGEDGGVFIVDFDKARRVDDDRDRVRDMYLRRWRRAVIKHSLSPLLVELLALHLRSSYE